MVFGLGKLFGSKSSTTNTPSPAPEENPVSATESEPGSAFIRKEPVFDRSNRLVGHIFRLQHKDAGLGDAPTRRQKPLDDALLTSLGGHQENWGETLAFIPLCSASLDHLRIERLPRENTVILIVLSPETNDGDALKARLQFLQGKGLRLGIFRQPKHPLFSIALETVQYGAIDVAASEGGSIRDFSIAIRSNEVSHPVDLFAADIETADDYHLARQCRFEFFHGPFFKAGESPDKTKGDPHKLHLLSLMNLVQSNAESAEIAAALKQDPMLTYRILRYLNSPAIGLAREITSIDQALLVLGRQRLARWISVLLFSVKEPDFADWLLVESALGRGRVMELLGAERFPAAEGDHLFLTGVFSCLDRLLRMPLPEALAQIKLAANIRHALLERSGPYAPLLAVAEACEAFDPPRIAAAAASAGLEADAVNHALLAATAWASEVSAHWE